jgi:hypothetical protein
MRVGFDEQIFLLQKRGGVSRYFVELIREFASNSSYGIEPVVDFKSTSNEMLFGLSEELGLGLTFDRRKKPLSLASESAKSLLNLTNVDLIHHTFYSKLFWQPRFSGPRVSTHYDMIPELYKERRFFVNPHLSKKFYFKNVNHVLAISDSAKSDLLSIWPDIDTSISVTHLASREMPNLSAKRVRGNVLFVGVRQGYKDAGTLINAFAKVPEGLRGNLIFAGGGPFRTKREDPICRTRNIPFSFSGGFERLGVIGSVLLCTRVCFSFTVRRVWATGSRSISTSMQDTFIWYRCV